MRRLALSLLGAFLALLAPLPVLAGGQTVQDGKLLVDEDYRFRLERPGPRWRLLDEQEVAQIVPDAVAGAVASGGVYGVVIVESAPGLDLDVFASTILDGMPLEEKTVERNDRMIYQSLPARRVSVTGRIDDIPVRYRLTVFANQGFAYQVIAWSVNLGGNTRAAEFDAFERAFSVTEGKPQGRSTTQAQRDLTGVGWRIRDGVFESAAYTMRIRPPAPWTLVVGDELRMMNEDAEIGLQCSNPEAYVVLIPEVYAGADKEAFATGLRRATAENLGAGEALETREIDMLGATVALHGFDANLGLTLRFWHGTRFEGDICYQILGWYPHANEAAAWQRLRGALAAVERIPAREARALHRELSLELTSRTRVGPDHCLRGGRYIDFTYDFVFTRPSEGYWRLSTGQEARAANPDSILLIEEPTQGLLGYVIAEESHDLQPEEYHQAVMDMIWGEDEGGTRAKPRRVEVGGRQGLRHAAYMEVDGLEYWFDVTTLLHRGWAFQIIVSGLGDNRKHIEPAADVLRSAFSFPAGGLEAVERTASRHTDHRLGFAVDLEAADFRLQDLTPPALQGAGTVLFGGRDPQVVGYLAICALREEQDESFVVDLVRQMLGQIVQDWVPGEPQRVELTFRGRPATRLVWPASKNRTEVLIVHRDQTLYLVVQVGSPGGGRAPSDRLIFLD